MRSNRFFASQTSPQVAHLPPTNNKTAHFTLDLHLPDEIIRQIVDFRGDILPLRLVSSQWQHVIDDRYFWQQILPDEEAPTTFEALREQVESNIGKVATYKPLRAILESREVMLNEFTKRKQNMQQLVNQERKSFKRNDYLYSFLALLGIYNIYSGLSGLSNNPRVYAIFQLVLGIIATLISLAGFAINQHSKTQNDTIQAAADTLLSNFNYLQLKTSKTTIHELFIGELFFEEDSLKLALDIEDTASIKQLIEELKRLGRGAFCLSLEQRQAILEANQTDLNIVEFLDKTIRRAKEAYLHYQMLHIFKPAAIINRELDELDAKLQPHIDALEQAKAYQSQLKL